MMHFVILIHDHPFVHWDLLMESGEIARTWRLLESPARWLSDPSIKFPAESIAAHRLMYLNYEGSISRERGRVIRWDHGMAEWLSDGKHSVRLRLNGEQLIGELALDRESMSPLWSARFTPAAPA